MKVFERQQCEESLRYHYFHYNYFMAAGSPTAAAVYARAIERVKHFMYQPRIAVYAPKKVYQPTKRGSYAKREV